MRRLTLLALCLALAAASLASADVPLPPDVKYVTPRVRFEGIDKYADYVFFLKYYSGQGNPFASPPKYIEVKNTEAFDMTGGRRIVNVQLFAVAREDAAKLQAKDASLAWLSDKTPGVVVASVIAPSTTAPASVKEVAVTTYRVKLEEGKLTVEKLPADKKRTEAPAGDRLPLAIIGTALAASLALFGLWLARRRRAEVI
jgi:hypothetical protein